jgi:hypothetical protein
MWLVALHVPGGCCILSRVTDIDKFMLQGKRWLTSIELWHSTQTVVLLSIPQKTKKGHIGLTVASYIQEWRAKAA